MTNSVLTNSRIEFEGHLGAFMGLSDEQLIDIKDRYTGDEWKLNKASLQRADLCPFALKEAYLKALDLKGIKRPDSGRFVENSETYTGASFWKVGVNPTTYFDKH